MSHLITRKYGWKKSQPDERDYRLKTTNPLVYKSLPPSVDLSKLVPEVLDQEDEGACTAHSTGMAFRIALIKQGLKDFRVSRQFIYANERIMEGTLNQDGGAEIRDGMKILATMGVPPEELWPYTRDNMFMEPSADAYKAAVQHESATYLRVDQTLEEMKLCLSEGYPFAFGVVLFKDFESEKVALTGVVPMPPANPTEKDVIGGHAILCVGYNDANKTFKVLNSWSDKWGDNGYCYFPYDYLTNQELCSDLWTIRTIAPEDPNRVWVVPPVPAANTIQEEKK